MNVNRITQLRVSGLRALGDVTLDLAGLTVLIGDNGTGKSSIIEAIELLRQAALSPHFIQDTVQRRHGGLRSLLRTGAAELRLGARIAFGEGAIDYDLCLGYSGSAEVVLAERAASVQGGASRMLLERHGTTSHITVSAVGEAESVHPVASAPELLLLPALASPTGTPGWAALVATALGMMDVQAPFDSRSMWLQQERGMTGGPRWPSLMQPTRGLERHALNLSSAFYALRDRGVDSWNRVLALVRLGLGEDVRDVRMPATGRGQIELVVIFGASPNAPVSVEHLSDGQVAYLAFVALCELDNLRSLLAFDEPELHLHPALLTRVLFMLEEVAQRHPVILSTHSDRLLDALSAPADQVVLCELDENRATRLVRPNAKRLASWMQDYRGLGSIRAEGYEPHVFDETPVEPEDAP